MGADSMDGTTEALNILALNQASAGVTSFLPTTMSDSWDRTMDAIDSARKVMKNGRDGAEVLGVYLEGPFLSRERCGAQNVAYLANPADFADSQLDDLIADIGDVVRVATVAPEIPGGLDLIGKMHDRGIVVSIGHMDADYDTTMAAFNASELSIAGEMDEACRTECADSVD